MLIAYIGYMMFLLFLTSILAFDAEAAPKAMGVVQVISKSQDPLGSGVFIESNVVLTARHVVEGIDSNHLSVKDSDGVIYAVSKVITEKKPYSPLINDYAFLLVSGNFLGSAKMNVKHIPQKTTIVGFSNGEIHTEESSKNQITNGLLLHCSESVRGFSGAPVFNENGEIVAIQNGIMKMKCLCPGMEYVSVATPVKKIIDQMLKVTPEIAPYLHQ